MVLVYVPAGEFVRGGNSNDSYVLANELPQRTLSLSAFWIDRTEVTNAQYSRCVQAGGCTAQKSTGSYFDQSAGSYYGNSAYDQYPVIYVTWEQADDYCRWAGRRLPTEAEWEKAARGSTDSRRFPWGEWMEGGSPGQKLNYCDANCAWDPKDESANDGIMGIAPIGSYPVGASPYGAYDMAGNVWEWVSDWYSTTYFALAPLQDPLGPNSGAAKIMRGGSFGDLAYALRVTARVMKDPAYYGDLNGFRCALSR